MCIDCLDEQPDAPAATPRELAWLARRIEADMSGEPVPDIAWTVYFGERTGALGWRELDRIARALDGARLVATLAGSGRP